MLGLLATAFPAAAAEWQVGFGAADFSSEGARDGAAYAVELHAAPFAHRVAADFNVVSGMVLTARGDLWLGAGWGR
jgi:hypothetical protein